MRSYNQRCGLAKALDLVGDRWTFLVVRELLIRGACRYTDLKDGLPGIATNLLAERLNELEAAGVVAHHEAPPPVATRLYTLTERGKDLEPALLALGKWGASQLGKPAKGDVFQPHWLVLPLRLHAKDHRPAEKQSLVEIRAAGQSISITLSKGATDVSLGAPMKADAVMNGPPDKVLQLVAGRLDASQARAEGIELSGDVHALQRLIPSYRNGRRT